MTDASDEDALRGGNQRQSNSKNYIVKYNRKLEAAKTYALGGFKIFPCIPNDKNPAIDGWQRLATTDIRLINHWWKQNPEYNIGVLATPHLVLDVDIKPKKSIDGFKTLKNHPPLPKTFTVTSPNGGKHYYFSVTDPESLTNKQGFEHGLDIRAGGKGYSIGVGSVVDGKEYTTDSESFAMADCPDWVLQAAKKHKQKPKTASQNHSIDPDQIEIEEALNKIDPDCGYDMWIRLGMAIHSALPDDAGLRIWRTWSEQGEKHKIGECDYHWWNSFNAKGGITLSTLFYYANQTAEYCQKINHDFYLQGQNDTTIGETFVTQHQAEIIYDTSNKCWWIFQNGIWIGYEEAEKIIIALYKQTILDLKDYFQSTFPEGFFSDGKVMKWLNSAMNKNKQDAVLRIVQSRLSIGITRIDENTDLLGMRDMLYELSTNIARPADCQDLVFKSVGCNYNPLAEYPIWNQFLSTAMQGDVGMIGYLQRLVGYFLSASTKEQEIYFFYGTGANGKSTFLDVIVKLLNQYAVKISSDTIMKSSWNERSNATMAHLANLAGARLAVTDELNDSNSRFDSQTLKSISGDEEITARKLYHNPIKFKSTAKVVMYGNDKPYGNINDEGFWRRFRFIPFEYVVPEHQRDKDLLSKLTTELPGILNWALEGHALWLKSGLQTPRKILDESLEYRKELDTVTEFLDTFIVYDLNSKIKTKELFDRYGNWTEENLLIAESANSFSRKSKQYFDLKGIKACKVAGLRGYNGVKIA